MITVEATTSDDIGFEEAMFTCGHTYQVPMNYPDLHEVKFRCQSPYHVHWHVLTRAQLSEGRWVWVDLHEPIERLRRRKGVEDGA